MVHIALRELLMMGSYKNNIILIIIYHLNKIKILGTKKCPKHYSLVYLC